MAELMGQSVRLYAESETKFFLRVAQAQITFVRNDAGEVTGLVVHMGGRDQPGDKVR